MNWLFLKRSDSNLRGQKKKKKHKYKNIPKTQANRPDEDNKFRAVKIVCDSHKSCAAALENAEAVFLCKEAPWLPLDQCDCTANCRCRYEHLHDRRTELRRDSDNGLPDRVVETERRRRRDRRRYVEPSI